MINRSTVLVVGPDVVIHPYPHHTFQTKTNARSLQPPQKTTPSNPQRSLAPPKPPKKHTQALAMLQRQLDVDILVTGHTHKNDVLELGDGKWLINPGSITGAYGGLQQGDGVVVVPSFVLLAVQGAKVVAYVYEEKSGQVREGKCFGGGGGDGWMKGKGKGDGFFWRGGGI